MTHGPIYSWSVTVALSIYAFVMPNLSCGSDGNHTGASTGTSALARTATNESPVTRPSANERTTARAPIGQVAIKVTWKSAPAAVRRPQIRNRCGAWQRAPVGIHALGGVRDVVVRLVPIDSATKDSVARMKAQPPPVDDSGNPQSESARVPSITVSNCRAQPRIVLVEPAAPRLEICNQDEGRRHVVVEPLVTADATARTTEGILAVSGSCLSAPVPHADGWRLSTDGDAAEYAYAFAPRSGLSALTNMRGIVEFLHVPTGAYDVKLWYPPLSNAGEEASQHAHVFDQSQRIDVAAGQTLKVEISLDNPGHT